jgi:hypothetical protein
MNAFLEFKHFNQTTVKYAVERLVVLLNDCSRTDLSGRIDILYNEICKAVQIAETSKSNHEFRLNMLSASKQSKGLINLIRFIKIYKIIVVLNEDYSAFEELIELVERARRHIYKGEHTFKALD